MDIYLIGKLVAAFIIFILVFPSLLVWLGLAYTMLHGGKSQRSQIGKAFDCLGNAVSGGSYNVMVSERVGREAAKEDGKLRYKVMSALINMAALPFEKFKWGHCQRAAAE